MLAILAVVAGCLWHVWNQAGALVNPGPSHDKFMTELKGGLSRDAIPEVKKLSMQAMERLGPAVQKEVAKIELRMPELAARAEQEFSLLRDHLPERAERALKPSIGRLLDRRLAEWQKQYPGLTADQLAEASTRLINETQSRMANIASIVILPYESTFEKVVADLGEIRRLEAGHEEVDPWDLAVVSIGILHEELAKHNPPTHSSLIASTATKEVK